MQPSKTKDDLVLGRYAVLDKVLGEGGWCKVVLSQDDQAASDACNGKPLQFALKTYREQTVREVTAKALSDRFAWEIEIFRKLGLSAPHTAAGTSKGAPKAIVKSKSGGIEWTPNDLFVTMVDFSRQTLNPAVAADGRFYSVLELGDEPLDACLDRLSSDAKLMDASEIRLVLRSLTSALAWMHRHDLVHCDVKPANIMKFGDRWKLIDLEGAVVSSAEQLPVDLGCFTPIYAAPEIGQAVLADPDVRNGSSTVLQGLRMSPAMDIWAAGVVLLDVVAHECAFQETWSGYQAQYMFDCLDDGGFGFLEEWYKFIADPTPIRINDYLSPSRIALLEGSPEMQDLLAKLLVKDPASRLSAGALLQCEFLSVELSGGTSAAQQDSTEQGKSSSRKRSWFWWDPIVKRCCRPLNRRDGKAKVGDSCS